MTRKTPHLSWLASLFCLLVMPFANSAYSQTDSELVNMSVFGSYSFGGFRVSVAEDHRQVGNVAFDSLHVDTGGFSFQSSWNVYPYTVTYSYPHLTYTGPIAGSTSGSDGFSLDIDTINHLLLNVKVSYSFTYTMFGSTDERIRHATFDSVSYTFTNKVLHASIQHAPMRLRDFGAYDYQGYSQTGISGSKSATYSLIKDSLFAPYFNLDLTGLYVKAVDLEKQYAQLHLFPNPCKDEINFTVSATASGPIRVYDLLGQLLMTVPVSSKTPGQVRLDTHSLTPGTYILATSKTSTLFSVVR